MRPWIACLMWSGLLLAHVSVESGADSISGPPFYGSPVTVIPENPSINQSFVVKAAAKFDWTLSTITSTSVWTVAETIHIDLGYVIDPLLNVPQQSYAEVEIGGHPVGEYEVVVRLINLSQGSTVVDTETEQFNIGFPGPLNADRFEDNGGDTPTVIGAVAIDRWEHDLTIHSTSDEDYFNVTLTEDQRVGILFDHAEGDLDLQFLWPQFPAGWFMTIAASSSTTDNELVTNPDMHSAVTVRVFGKTGTETHPNYDLFIVGPFRQPYVTDALHFGDVDVGSSSNLLLTIRNEDAVESLEVISIVPPSGFTCSWSGSIPPETSQQIPVSFDPLWQLDFSGRLRVRCSRLETIEPSVSGRGVQSVVRLENDLTFGAVEVGSSSNRILMVCNDGNESMVVDSLVTTAGFSCDWSGSIPGGETNYLPITFRPTRQQIYTGTVSVTSDADVGSGTTHVQGTGKITRTLDSDGDGFCDAHEFIAGTHPNNSNSFFCLSSGERLASNQFVFTWGSTTGRVYNIYESTNPSQGFMLSQANIPNTAPTNVYVTTEAGTQLFIKVDVSLDE